MDQLIQDRDVFLLEINDLLRQVQQIYKQQYDKGHRELEFTVGQWVWLRLYHRHAASLSLLSRGKLGPQYFGPYQVLQKIGMVAYRLQLPIRAKIHDVFHISLLILYVGPPPPAPPALPPPLHGRVCPMPA